MQTLPASTPTDHMHVLASRDLLEMDLLALVWIFNSFDFKLFRVDTSFSSSAQFICASSMK